MLKITHFGKYYFPDAGGIESVTLSLARGAVEADKLVSVVCFEKTPSNSFEILDGVHVIRSPIKKMIASQPLGLQYCLNCIKEAKNSDIVHLHAPNMLGALCALFMRKEVKLLLHWHSDVINKGILGIFLRPLERALLKRSNVVVATSDVYANASKTLSSFREKVVVVPIGVPDIKLTTMIGGSRLGLPSGLGDMIAGKKIVLAVGRLVPYKGFDVLIEASKNFDDETAVVIVGGGPLVEELKLKIKNSGVSDRVFLAGRLTSDELHVLFKMATIYCLPSTYRAEAFGVVILEAMAYDLPVVASDIAGSGVPWVNQHGVSGLNFTVGDSKALADACNQILHSELLHSTFSKGARERFLSEFTEDLFVSRIMAIYDRLSI